MVTARNEETGVSGIFPVFAVMKGESTALRWLTLANTNGQTSRLGLTGGHPMFVVGAGWVHADEVVEGDRIRNADLHELTVLSIEADTRPQIVHNLEIADAHTYFAGELEAWGHNRRKSFLQTARQNAEQTKRDGSKREFFCKTNSRGQKIWISGDTAGHGGSALKVFQQVGNKLVWQFDADEFGDRICGKHKGPTGKIVNLKDLN